MLFDVIDSRLIFPILFIVAFIFWATLAILVEKVFDIIERKCKDKCN